MYEELSLEQLEAGIRADHHEILKMRALMQEKHNAAEAKRALIPITPTSKDQIMLPGKAENALDWVMNLPANIRDTIKNKLNGGE